MDEHGAGSTGMVLPSTAEQPGRAENCGLIWSADSLHFTSLHIAHTGTTVLEYRSGSGGNGKNRRNNSRSGNPRRNTSQHSISVRRNTGRIYMIIYVYIYIYT